MTDSNKLLDIGIGIVGAGRAGSSLAAALHACGYRIQAVIDNDLSKAENCARKVDSEIYGSSLQELAEAGLIIISVPDGVITDVACQLADEPLIQESAIILHVSGVLPASVLYPLAETGNRIASCHPCMILNFAEHNVFQGATFTLEGDPAAVEILKNIVKTLGAKAVIIDPAQKPLYHAACCVASNYLVTLLHSADGMLKCIDADLSTVMPLVRATLSDIQEKGIDNALTGPILRGDVQTIETHLEVIEETFPDLLPVYKIMGRATVDLASNTLTDSDKISALKKLFKQSGSEQNETDC